MRRAVLPTLIAMSLLWTSCPKQAPPATSTAPQAGTPDRDEPVAAASGDPANPDDLVTFRDRTVDLKPFFEGFPYRGFEPIFEAGKLFYYEESDTRTLRWVPLEPGADLAAGAAVSSEDFTRRNVWFGLAYHPPSDSLILQTDEDNTEVFNLYRLTLADGALQQLTDHEYIYGYGMDPGHRFVAYLPRHGATEPYRTCLHVLDLESGEDREVVCDDGLEQSFTWCELVVSPDGTRVLFNGNHEGDRARHQLLMVDLTADEPQVERLTDPATRRFTAAAHEEWLDDERFLYLADDDGFENLYRFDLATRTSTQLTSFTEETGSLQLLRVGERPVAALTLVKPHESELVLVDPGDGTVLSREVLDASAWLFDRAGDRSALYQTSARSRFRMDLLQAVDDGAGGLTTAREALLEVEPALQAQIRHCAVERVTYPTFDIDPATGEDRQLHAFLLTPREPVAQPEDRVAMIEAFYGGRNYWDTDAQIKCAAGITVLSPAVRGSGGFGTEFYALNDGDLGGDEIVDIIYAGRYLQEKLGLHPGQIGLYGGSHGGYATMRGLTFPPDTNDRGEHFDWGFGVSHAGFADIIEFYEKCNIPDWVRLEAGDPETERDKLLDRSPLTHVALLDAPLLLVHGENDNRVPVEGSRAMAAACAEAEKDCTYEEFAGQGHGLKGLPNKRRVYGTIFGFLDRVYSPSEDE